ASDYLIGVGVFLVTLVSAYECLKLAKIEQQSIFKKLIIFTIVVFVVAQFFIYHQYIFPIFWLYAINKIDSYESQKIDALAT
ncbi:phosphatidate cytidylyltransferase, partial [Francisella tularensis subsp. holarctica]|nr:phosphatidate cytidylyltransferase [Francisella tularensis subsp. holarctica]